MIPSQAAENAFEHVLEAAPGERVAIICDDVKLEVGRAFSEGALNLGLWTRLITLETTKGLRKEVPKHLLEIFSPSKPDLFINLLRGIGQETPFRIKLIHLETRDKRSRLGHCPGVNLEMLSDGALALTGEQHKKMQDTARSLMRSLNRTFRIEISSPSGTALSFSTEGRKFFTDTMIDWEQMKWMNLPTGEVLVAPIEDSMEGKLACDMAIGGIGPLKKTVILEVSQGTVTKVTSEDKATAKQVSSSLNTDQWAKVTGEFAFGVNPKAKSLNDFLETEKINETVHIAFGNNLDMPGGKNPSSNHMDFLISKPSVTATSAAGETRQVLKDGKFRI
ncbi:MAG: aminopeptidase [Candidatus Bathyarchaeota archaeon]|jgi:leucyl aminopeptidase (aminopeptidase T)|nr:MAG: aminopeptidase [Candidatus Bathyarchaeota archaeon]